MNVEDNVFMFAIPLISKLFFNQLWILSSVILHILLLQNLRFYFTTKLCLAADVLSLILLEAFNEFSKIDDRVTIGEEPIFNLIPVLGSGGCALANDLITCELFASKL